MNSENTRPEEKFSEITTFFAIWDENVGPDVLDYFPKSTMIGDIENIAMQIFQAYQFFWDTKDKLYQRTNICLPFNNINRKAKIYLDKIPDPEVLGSFKPYIVVVLTFDYFSDDQLKEYDKTLVKISQDFVNFGELKPLEEYFPDFQKVFALAETVKESEDKIEDYSYTAAMEDFQAGIKLFQTRNFDGAYEVLKKVLLKFEQENHLNLIMEVLYIIASLFTQQKKFKLAREYFSRLETLSEKVDHDKYLETSIFMQGFCLYKVEYFQEAARIFEKINDVSAKYLNKLQFYSIYGRILAKLEKYEEATLQVEKALALITGMEKSGKNLKVQSQLLYELGLMTFKIAINSMQNFGIHQKDNYYTHLIKAKEYFESSAVIFNELNDDTALIQAYMLIGNINEFLGNDDLFLQWYEKALEIAKKSKLHGLTVKILKKTIQKQSKLSLHDVIINKINDFLSNTEDHKFFDLYTIASFHRELGKSLIAKGETSEGLSEYIKTYDIYKNFRTPIYEEIELLEDIVKYSTELNENDKISHYTEEINKIKENRQETEVIKPKAFRPLADIKEIWIFSSTTGITIFTYAPETQIDHDLLGGFLTAIQQFSIELSQKEFDSMVVGNDRYIIYQEIGRDFYVLGRASVKSSEDTVKTILSVIFKRFWKEYAPDIKDFSGGVAVFESFKSIINTLDFTLKV